MYYIPTLLMIPKCYRIEHRS